VAISSFGCILGAKGLLVCIGLPGLVEGHPSLQQGRMVVSTEFSVNVGGHVVESRLLRKISNRFFEVESDVRAVLVCHGVCMCVCVYVSAECKNWKRDGECVFFSFPPRYFSRCIPLFILSTACLAQRQAGMCLQRLGGTGGSGVVGVRALLSLQNKSTSMKNEKKNILDTLFLAQAQDVLFCVSGVWAPVLL